MVIAIIQWMVYVFLYLFYYYFRKAFLQKQSANLSLRIFFLRFDHVKVKSKRSRLFDSHSKLCLNIFSTFLLFSTECWSRLTRSLSTPLNIALSPRTHASWALVEHLLRGCWGRLTRHGLNISQLDSANVERMLRQMLRLFDRGFRAFDGVWNLIGSGNTC